MDVQALIAQAEADGSVVGVSAIYPSGARFSHNGARRFVAASTVKIAIMIELFRQCDAGLLSLDAPHVLRPGDKAGGSGILSNLHDGIELTLTDLAYLMMSISDNSATNILIDTVGQGRVNALMQDLGMTGSTLGRRMRGQAAAAAEAENWAVPDDYARAVAALLDGTAASASACESMLRLLESQQNDRRIARHLPRVDRPRWGSKTGSLPGVANDVGFVFTPAGPVILALFLEHPDSHAAEHLLGSLSRSLLLDPAHPPARAAFA